MKSLYLVHGMQRSGNHAIINWIVKQKKMVFINNIYPIKHVIEKRITVEEGQDFDLWYKKELERKYGDFIGKIKRPFKKAYPILVSIEDHPVTIKPFVNTPKKSFNILILRDPKNFFASRIHRAWKVEHPAYPREMNQEMERVIQEWKAHAKEFLGDTNYLMNKVGIYYNLWFQSKPYRMELSRKLELPFSDKGKEVVTAYGGGSSFDGKAFDGKSDEMKVLERYKMLKNSERELFEEVMKDKEVQELSKRLTEYETSYLMD